MVSKAPPKKVVKAIGAAAKGSPDPKQELQQPKRGQPHKIKRISILSPGALDNDNGNPAEKRAVLPV